MSSNHEELLQRLAGVCCPGLTLSPAGDEAPLVLRGRARRKRAYFLFTRLLTLWTRKYTEYAFAFHVEELNFDTLAQCHNMASAADSPRPGHPSKKRNRLRITAIILCDTAQAEAFEAATRFAGQPQTTKTQLDYRLVVADVSTGEVACSHRARKFRFALRRQMSCC